MQIHKTRSDKGKKQSIEFKAKQRLTWLRKKGLEPKTASLKVFNEYGINLTEYAL